MVPVIYKESTVVDKVIDYDNSISTCDMWLTNTKSHLDTSSPRVCYSVISLVVNLYFNIILLSVSNNEFSESCIRNKAKSYSDICLFIFIICCPKGWSRKSTIQRVRKVLNQTYILSPRRMMVQQDWSSTRRDSTNSSLHVVCWVTGPTCWWFDRSCLWYNGISHKVKSCLPFWVNVLHILHVLAINVMELKFLYQPCWRLFLV